MTDSEEPTEQGSIRDEAGRFLPGVSGNPGGRPAAQPITDAIRAELEAMDAEGVRALVRAWIENSRRPGQQGAAFARLIAERIEGRMPQALQVEDWTPREIVYRFPHQRDRLVLSDARPNPRPLPKRDPRLLDALRRSDPGNGGPVPPRGR